MTPETASSPSPSPSRPEHNDHPPLSTPLSPKDDSGLEPRCSPQTRLALTIQQRQTVIAEHERRKENGLNCSQAALAEWATHHFKLRKPLSQPSISKILKKRHSILAYNANPSARRATPPRCSRLEKTLLNWIVFCLVKDYPLTGVLICEKAKQLFDAMNARPEGEKSTMAFSNGWLCNFKQRYNVKRWKASRKDGDLISNAHYLTTDGIRKRVQNYRIDDVFCVGEFGLKYTLSPDSSIAMAQRVTDRSKDFRITCLVCVNSTGSEKRPLCFVGRSKSPPSFNGKPASEHGFDYAWNKRACMAPDLFYSWLMQFDTHVGRQNNRKICLLVDISIAHGNEHTLPKLTNTEVIFLAAHSCLTQNPLHVGIVTQLKHAYRIQHMQLVLDRKEACMNNIYAISQLSAMQYMRDTWNQLDPMFIAACWRSIGILCDLDKLSGLNEYILPTTLREGREKLEEIIDKILPVSQRMSVDYLLCHPDEISSNDTFVEDDMLSDVLYDGNCEVVEPQLTFPSLQEQLRIVSMAKLILQDKVDVGGDAVSVLASAQKLLRARLRCGTGTT